MALKKTHLQLRLAKLKKCTEAFCEKNRNEEYLTGLADGISVCSLEVDKYIEETRTLPTRMESRVMTDVF